MTIINNFSDTKFTLNGIHYFKNYITKVSGDRIIIFNAYDSKDVLLDWTLFDQIQLNNVVYANINLLQENIIDICYARGVSNATDWQIFEATYIEGPGVYNFGFEELKLVMVNGVGIDSEDYIAEIAQQIDFQDKLQNNDKILIYYV